MIDKLWVIYKMEYYVAIKWKKPFHATCMNLKKKNCQEKGTRNLKLATV